MVCCAAKKSYSILQLGAISPEKDGFNKEHWKYCVIWVWAFNADHLEHLLRMSNPKEPFVV